MIQHNPKLRKRRRKTSKEERVCSICSQSFNKAEHLLRHIRSHTKEKPFECSACGRMYARQDTLLRHSRSHQPAQQDTLEKLAPEEHQYSHLNQSAPISPPNSRSIDGSSILETIIAEESSNQSPSTGTGLTTASDFAITSLDADGIRQCDLLPYWNFDHDPQRPYFDSLLSNDMDLGDLNMSLLNTATAESLPQVPCGDVSRGMRFILAPTAEPFTPDGSNVREPDSVIQRAWHTYCSNSSSGYVTPDPGQDQYAVDDDCHRDLVDKLQPRLQPGTLPSTSFLDLCVQAYLCHFHPLFPIIHAPSFRPHSQNGLLLLSMCSVGSLFIGSSRATAHGISMFERLHKAILSTWDTILSKSESVSHKAFQASVIGQMFGLLVGRPKDLMQVELFHGTMVVWARKLKLFRLKSLDADLALLEGLALEHTWKIWIRQEERRRTALGLLLLDAEIARLFHDKPVIRNLLHQLPVASSDEAFAAEDAISWRNIMLTESAHSLNIPNSWSCTTVQEAQLPDVRGTFGLYVLLQRIGASVSDNHESVSQEPERQLQHQNMLVLWHEKYRNTPMFLSQERYFMILWHSIFMLLNCDLDVLEIAAGRDGTDAMNTQKHAAEAWASSSQAQHCMAHSMLLQQQFEQIPLGSEPPLHAAACLYRCGIVWYCYARYGGTSPRGSESTEMPELEYLGIDGDGDGVLRDQVSVLLEKPLEATLLLIVDLLRRISHWKVADRFAATLLALVDDGQGLY